MKPTSQNSPLLIFGPGALGLYFAARLHQAGYPVVLGHKLSKVPESREVSVLVRGKGQTETLTLPIYAPSELLHQFGSFSLVIVTVKARHLQTVSTFLQRLQACFFLFPQNGAGFERSLKPALSGQFVRLVVTFGVTRTKPWQVEYRGDGEIWMEEKFLEPAAILQKAGFQVRLVEDIQPWVMRKFLVNLVINPLTTIFGVPNGDLTRVDPDLTLGRAILREGLEVLAAEGWHFNQEEIESLVISVLQQTAQNRSSMLQDLDRGALTEIDWITGYLLGLAKRQGIEVPYNETVYRIVKGLERKHGHLELF